MTILGTILLVLAVFISGVFSCLLGEILAHLVLYSRRGQARKGKRKSDGINDAFMNIIKHE